jgi:hypothetical protein
MMFHHGVSYCFCVPQNCAACLVAWQQGECQLWVIMSLLCSTTLLLIAASLPSCCHLEAGFCVAVIVVSCCSVGDEGSGGGEFCWDVWSVGMLFFWCGLSCLVFSSFLLCFFCLSFWFLTKLIKKWKGHVQVLTVVECSGRL